MEHRRRATAEEFVWLGPGSRGDVCRGTEGPRPVVIRGDQ